MTYRAWEQKPLDRTAVRELTAAIAEQAAAQLEEQAMDVCVVLLVLMVQAFQSVGTLWATKSDKRLRK